MPSYPLQTAALSALFIIAGLVIIILHKAIRRADDAWNDRVSWFWRSYGPRGTLFEVLLILFGALLMIIGSVSLIGVVVQH